MENKRYCINESGDVLYNIEIFDDPLKITMTFHCSIGRELISNCETERIISCLEERMVKDSLRRHFEVMLFNYINKIPHIEKHYFVK